MTHAGAASGILETFTTVQAFVGLATITHITFTPSKDEDEGAMAAAARCRDGSGGGGVGGAGESTGAEETRTGSRGRYVACGDGGHLAAGELAGTSRARARDSSDFCSLRCNVS